jgi:hypothetical protein
MTRDDEQGQSGIFGRGLPGTGGDLRRDDDVEGHKRVRFDGSEDDAEGVARRGGPDHARALPTDEDDVEGHRVASPDACTPAARLGSSPGAVRRERRKEALTGSGTAGPQGRPQIGTATALSAVADRLSRTA